MILQPLRARLLAVAGLLAPVSASLAFAADAAAPAPAPAFAPVVAPCPGGCPPVMTAPAVGCDGCATVGPVLGGYTGLGSTGTGVGLFADNPRWWRKRQRIDGQNQPACAVNSYPLSDWAYIRRYCRPTILPGTCYGHFQTKWRRWEDHCPQQGGAVGCDPFAVGGAVYPTPAYPTAAPVLQAPPAYTPPSQPLPAPTPQPLPMPVPAPMPMTPKTSADLGGLPAPELPAIPVLLPSTLK